MRVRDVMTEGAECVRPSNTLQEAALRMKNLNVGALLVCDNDRLVGMITDRDIVVRAVNEGYDIQATIVQDVMTAEVLYCFEDEDVQEAAQRMSVHQVRRLVVFNQNNRLVGLVSLGDLALETRDRMLVGKTLEHVSLPM
jgi:CBS domain-containing protein